MPVPIIFFLPEVQPGLTTPVSVDTFMKASSLIYYSQEGIWEDADDIIKLAQVEGLTAHANSVRVRKESDE